jgi:hypothetical protein
MPMPWWQLAAAFLLLSSAAPASAGRLGDMLLESPSPPRSPPPPLPNAGVAAAAELNAPESLAARRERARTRAEKARQACPRPRPRAITFMAFARRACVWMCRDTAGLTFVWVLQALQDLKARGGAEMVAETAAQRSPTAAPPSPPSPPSTLGLSPSPPQRPLESAPAGGAGWYRVDDGGSVAFRKSPNRADRTDASAVRKTPPNPSHWRDRIVEPVFGVGQAAGQLVYAAREPAAHPGWVQTEEALWLERAYLLPLAIGERLTPAQVEEARAVHMAAADIVFGTPPPPAPPLQSPPTPLMPPGPPSQRTPRPPSSVPAPQQIPGASRRQHRPPSHRGVIVRMRAGRGGVRWRRGGG